MANNHQFDIWYDCWYNSDHVRRMDGNLMVCRPIFVSLFFLLIIPMIGTTVIVVNFPKQEWNVRDIIIVFTLFMTSSYYLINTIRMETKKE